MTYSAMDVAALVVEERVAAGRPVVNLGLQKLLCLLWVDWYRTVSAPLFHDPVEVWFHGPAVPSVYFRYRVFAADPIRRPVPPSPLTPASPGPSGLPVPEPDASLLSDLLRRYSAMSTSDLVAAATAPGTPWALAGGRSALGARIPKALMARSALSSPTPPSETS